VAVAGNSFGQAFRITTFGESHGGALGVVIDGCPPDLPLDLAAVQAALDRRRPGTSPLVSARREPDQAELVSGLFAGRTLGGPLTLLVRNADADARAYALTADQLRPSHADYSVARKYGHSTWQGGGRASARETVARVAAGAVAAQVLAALCPGLEVLAWVQRLGGISALVDEDTVSAPQIEASLVRCPDPAASAAMVARIEEVRARGDTVGGVIRYCARGVPAGLGEPVFDKLEADLGKALLSLPAAKGVESGSGFGGVDLTGSAHNDPFVPDGAGGARTTTNRSGGVQGGISNGMPVTGAVAFKPVATIFSPQQTINTAGEAVELRARGRHDPCVLPRAVPMVEAMVLLVLCDHLLRLRAQTGRVGPAPLRPPAGWSPR
jgi:chorismate synthase